MNFMVKDSEDKEHGPLNEDTLIKWVDVGDINSETPMRNALMAQWKKASDFKFLKEPFERQVAALEKDKGFFDKLTDSKTKKKEENKSSAFEYKYLPDPAGLRQRLAATFFDFALLAVPALILYFISLSIFYFADINSSVPVPEAKEPVKMETSEKGKIEIPQLASFESETNPRCEDNAAKGFVPGSRWKNTAAGATFVCVGSTDTSASWVTADLYDRTVLICVLVFFTIFLLYYGLLLGLYAQTFGMWFWGIFIVRPGLEEVYLLRAFVFTIAMFFTGILSPAFVFISSSRRSFDDILAGVIFLKIAGKPKA